jgi:uncharacterized protein (TIGR00369 family)
MTKAYAASRPEDLVPPQQMLSMSGLEFMTEMIEGRLAGPPIARTLNFSIQEVEKGRVVFRGIPTFDAMNPMGAVHGGWYGALLDSCLGCAVMSMLPKGSYYTTLEYKVNITRAIPMGMEVEAVGEIQHFGRSTGVARGEIRGLDDGRVYATGSTTCLIMQI